MNSKNNRRNHDFQIAYFLAGSCHTYDSAYSLLCDLKEEREMALAQLESSNLRQQAQIIKANKMINSENEDEQLEGKAIIADINNNKKFAESNINAAIKELEFINKCIEKIQPLRKYSNLPDDEAHEAIQCEEWRLELINRIENSLLATGQISIDEFSTLRKHPEFTTHILPEIDRIKDIISKGDPLPVVMNILQDRKINIPNLLEVK